LGLYRKLCLDLDFRSQTQLYLGLLERETHRYIRRIAGKCDWFIDVGAGHGELCLFFLKQPRRVGVVAIEPSPDEVATLRRNLALNGIADDDVEIVTKFVGSGDTADTIMLDAVDVDRNARGFVKIDVEGAELNVLHGGSRLLRPELVDLLIETHSLEIERECMAWLAKSGYQTEVIHNAWWRRLVPEYRPIEHNRWLWATSPSRNA
jgi:hypothetical protein